MNNMNLVSLHHNMDNIKCYNEIDGSDTSES